MVALKAANTLPPPPPLLYDEEKYTVRERNTQGNWGEIEICILCNFK